MEQVLPGQPPILWSDVDRAFTVINQNFSELEATILGGGGAVVDFSNLSTNVSPSSTEVYDLGSSTKKWRDLYLSGSSLYLGDAVITATGTTVNLPVGSTIGGLRVDENYFKFIAVSGQSTIEADEGTDTLTVAAGNAGITLTTNAGTDTLTITNSGVTNAVASTGISVSAATGSVTFTNTGVTSLTAGQGVSLNTGTGAVTVTNSGLIGIDPGIGITVSPRDPVTGLVTVTNSQPNIPQNVFNTIAVPTQSDVIADSTTDTLTLQTSGNGLSITTDASTDTVTFSNTGVTSLAVGNGLTASAGTGSINLTLDDTLSRNIIGDLQGSVFADDSTMIVDATNGVLRGSFEGRVLGDITGSVFADDSTKLVDAVDGVIVGPVVTPSLSIDGTFNFDTTGMSNQLASITVPSGGSLSIIADTSPVNFEGSSEGNVVVIEDGDITANTVFATVLNTQDSSTLLVVPPVNFQTTITADQGIQLNGPDAIIRSDGNIRLVPTNSVESIGAELTITGLDVMGEPNVIIETATGQGTIQIGGDNNNTASVTVRKSTGEVYVGGFWRFLADGGLYSGYLDSPPDSPTAGAFYVADGATWDPASKSGAVPYPVFWDGASYHALY